MINGSGSLSVRKSDLENQKVPAVGFRKTVFAHKAVNGESGINLASLTTPAELTSQGFSQPSLSELQNAQLLFYRNNLRLTSSLRGELRDYLSYTVGSSTQINFIGFTALEGEIFIGTIDYNAQTGIKVVDASPIIATGTLSAGNTDFNVGVPFKTGQYSGYQVGSVLVFVDGVQQFRNSGNSSTVLDGNYCEVDAGGGLGVVIRFNASDPVNDRSVFVVSNGLLSERPDGSMMATIESVQGQVNNMATYVAALAGQTTTTILGAAPSNVDLKAFGDRVFAIETSYAKINVANSWSVAQDFIGRTTAATAGKVGEVLTDTAATLTQTSPVAATAYYTANALSLQPGLYAVVATGTPVELIATGTSQMMQVSVDFTGGSATAYGQTAWRWAPRVTGSQYNSSFVAFTVLVTATTIAKMYIMSSNFISGTPGTPTSMTIYTPTIMATRIA